MEKIDWVAITTVDGQEYRIPVSANDSVSAIQKAAAKFKTLLKSKFSYVSEEFTIRVSKE